MKHFYAFIPCKTRQMYTILLLLMYFLGKIICDFPPPPLFVHVIDLLIQRTCGKVFIH